jgi:hypothetical protein
VRAVLAPVDQVRAERAPGGECLPHGSVEGSPLDAALQDARILTQDLRARVAADPLEGRVDVFDVGRRVGDDHCVIRLLDGGRQPSALCFDARRRGARLQSPDPVAEIGGQFLEECHLLRSERIGLRGIQAERADDGAITPQWYGRRRRVPKRARLRAPRSHRRVGGDVAADNRPPLTHRRAGRSVPLRRIVPGQRERGRVLVQRPGPGDWPDGARRIVLGVAHPGTEKGAPRDDRFTERLQQRLLVGRAYEGLVGYAECPQHLVLAGELLLGARPLGVVGDQESGQQRAADGDEGPAFERGHRREGVRIADQDRRHPITKGDPNARDQHVREHDAASRHARSVHAGGGSWGGSAVPCSGPAPFTPSPSWSWPLPNACAVVSPVGQRQVTHHEK